MAFSATDAAFEGFRVVRRKPMTLVYWSVFYMLIMAATFAVAGAGLANMFATLESVSEGTPSSEDFATLGSAYLAVFGLLLPLGLVVGAVLSAAVARSVLRPHESAFGYLRLGRDELRVLAVTLVLAVMFAVALAVPSMVVGTVLGLAGANALTGVLLGIVLFFALAAFAIWLMVRFSFAVPMTVAEGRMVFFGSFKATKGRFWPLLGMAFIAFVMSMLVALLGTLVFLPFQVMFGSIEGIAEYSGQDALSILQAVWPTVLTWIVVQSIQSALQLAVLYAPFSAAYRDIVGDKPERAFE